LTTQEFLDKLRQLDVRIWVDGDRVRCDAPRGVLTAELREELARRRDEVMTILAASRVVERDTMPVVPRVARGAEAPVSFTQQRLWFLHKLMPESTAFTIVGWFPVTGRLDVAALRQAVNEVVRRHEALRTTFTLRDGEPVQVIQPAAPVSVDLVDVPCVAAAPDQAIEALARQEAELPTDLERGPLFRVRLVRRSAENHALLFSVNHIVFDGWSLGILAREITTLYAAYAAGLSSPLPPLPIQFADFAVWQRQKLTGETLERQRRYWTQQLAGPPPPLEFPTDRPRSGKQQVAGARHTFAVPTALAHAVNDLARKEGATPFMVLLAAFAAVLHRYTGQDDIALGSPIANRTRVELEGLIGFFANTLVLRTDVSGDPTFAELVRRVREVTLGAYEHQDMPFEKLVEELQPERVLGQNPLFQMSFVFQKASPGLDVRSVTVASQFELSLFLTEMPDGVISGVIEYRTALFDAETIERLARHFTVLLAAGVSAPDTPVAALPLLDETERRRLTVEWNATSTEYPRDRCIHELFEEQAAATPTAVALVAGTQSVTYAELNRRASELAKHLRRLGVGPEALVGLWMERSIEALVAVLGILKAGGAYVPFDLAAPRERVAFMLRHAEIGVVLTQERLADQLPGSSARVVCLDVEPSWVTDTADIASTVSHVEPDALAYVMYTSGSTGEPKGVAVSHRNVVRLVRGTDYVHFGSDEVFVLLAPLSFDASTFEIWGSLLNGGCLAIAPPGVPTVSELATILKRYEVTTLWLTAGLFHQVVDHGIGALTGLRQLLAGGDVVSVHHARRIVEEVPGCRLINGYGPTEGTTFTCCHLVTADSVRRRSIPIGRPIRNTRVYVLDRYRRPVPVGVAGDLWIAGDGVAHGYFKRIDLTLERFVDHRFDDGRKERLYRSGDIVRYLPDGSIEFLGRADDQVKLRGFRIELGEVEATLTRHLAVRDAVAVVHGTGGDKRLIAYVVLETPVTTAELRAFAGERLPSYMMPAAFVTVEQLPLTANGKVDRRRLPPPPEPHSEREAAVAPRDELEKQLVRIWEECLGVRPIGIHDDFFELGGHSLLAIRLFARLEEALEQKLPLAMLFQAPSVAQLAALIRGGGFVKSWRALVPIQSRGTRPPLFAVPGVDGQPIGFHRLAQLLGDDQPLYGLQSRGLDGRERPLARLEDIAAYFVDELRELYPQGPCYVIGACMGGVIAFEMARQLQAAGREVRFLGLIDAWPPPVSSPGRRDRIWAHPVFARLGFVVGRIGLYLRTMSLMTRRERVRYLVGRLRAMREMIVMRDVFRGDSTELRVNVVTRANLVAFQTYVPKPYAGPAVQFRAKDRRVTHIADARLVWQGFTTSLKTVDVPGDSTGAILGEPHVRVLAAKLQACLQAADAQHSDVPAR
jgi:aspartate racemase